MIDMAKMQAALESVDEIVANVRARCCGDSDSTIMLLVGALIVAIGESSVDLAKRSAPEAPDGGPVFTFARRLYTAEMFGAVFSTLELARTTMAPRTDTKPAVTS